MKKLGYLSAGLLVLAMSFQAAAASKVIFKDDFEGDLTKWTINDEAISNQAVVTDVISHSGNQALNMFGWSTDGFAIYAPSMDIPEGYVEAWMYDPTGDRSAWIDQAYLIIEGESGTKATCQLGQHGNPVTSENQSKYAIYFDGDEFRPSETQRAKGWRKFGFELLPNGECRTYIDDKLQSEFQNDDWTSIKRVGFLFYYSKKRDDAIGVPIHEAYWDDLVVYDKKPEK
jgi:hypothetical protein